MSQSIQIIIEKGLSSLNWPYLESIIKDLTQFMESCIKKREYLQAQKAKERLLEAGEEMKRRSMHGINIKEEQSIGAMTQRHQQQRQQLQKENTLVRKRIEAQFDELINKKRLKQDLQRQKQLQQIQIAIPLQQSPDKLIYRLRQEEEELARTGNFIDAQKVKVQIAKKQQQINQKATKLREANIKVMMGQLQGKQKSEMLMLESRRQQKLEQGEKSGLKREREMSDKQLRQLKQARWYFGEERKKIK